MASGGVKSRREGKMIMAITIMLNVVTLVVVVGGWSVAVTHLYRVLGRDGQPQGPPAYWRSLESEGGQPGCTSPGRPRTGTPGHAVSVSLPDAAVPGRVEGEQGASMA